MLLKETLIIDNLCKSLNLSLIVIMILLYYHLAIFLIKLVIFIKNSLHFYNVGLTRQINKMYNISI